MGLRNGSLNFYVKDIHLDLGVGSTPKEAALKYTLVIKNNRTFDIEIESLKSKITVADIVESFHTKNLTVKAAHKAEIHFEKVLSLWEFTQGVYSHFIKQEPQNYKLRGLAVIRGEFFHIKKDGIDEGAKEINNEADFSDNSDNSDTKGNKESDNNK
jgi:LEA14-like dessication related protein